MCRKSLKNWPRESGFCFPDFVKCSWAVVVDSPQAVVRLSFGVSNRQAGPHVQQAEIFADDTKSVGRRAPPVRCVEVIFRRGADKYASATVSARDFFPERTNPARVSFRGDNNYRGTALLIESLGDDMKLVRGVQDTRFQDANIAGTHPLFDQHHAAVFLLARVREMKTFHCRAGFKWLRQPHFLRIAIAINFCCGQGAAWKATAEHNDGLGLFEGIFTNEPRSGVIERVNARENKQHDGKSKRKDGAAP